MHWKRSLLCLAAVCCIAFGWFGAARAETLQECHKVQNTAEETRQENGSRIKKWHVETALPAVSDEINGIADAWAEELGPELEKAQNNGMTVAQYLEKKITDEAVRNAGQDEPEKEKSAE